MAIGHVVDIPNAISGFGIVRSEYGDEHTVHASALHEKEEGDDLAYYVAIGQNDSGNYTVLQPGSYGPEG